MQHATQPRLDGLEARVAALESAEHELDAGVAALEETVHQLVAHVSAGGALLAEVREDAR